MNSIELNNQFRRLSVDSSSSGTSSSSSSSSSSFPSQSEMLSASMMSHSTDTAHEFELDCSRFNSFSPSVSHASSFNSLSSAHESTEQRLMGGLSRSRCAHNLSALCSTSTAGSTRSTRQVSYESGPKAGWGYFVDTPSR
mmetsp:Transcript_29171/g.55318  ORF Transcript_29171/g.55318 Transcript_29171/m.55318 type:complete len:140 (-) Transcript_29171:769-1188(-)|eukprot:CAMPEP_0201657442 /NCGR_PEP_ID=MMETSP0494-20130426/703_1 /ASSEMBLY_ACC=CAM_ASM_000839 /TAXON_ID=420259 /ORGANISM="Thalassiosira gravida, Strain GMp14c1" /LENGTH=139 /DNA_ID=CAMNT_0048134297 /DNA_START=247 /DNA_END=666 /DNA_ORIENTATION=+